MTETTIFCSGGSEVKTGSPCAGLQDLASASWLTSLWPGGVPGFINDIIVGLELGSIAVGSLCSIPPVDPGNWDPSWLLPSAQAQGTNSISQWLAKTAYWHAWQACCQCKLPPDGVDAEWADINGQCWGATTEQIYLGQLPGSGPWAVHLDGEVDACSGSQAGRCYIPTVNYYSVATTGTNNCYGYTGAGNDLSTGWGAGPACSGPNIPFATNHAGGVGQISGNQPTCIRVKFSGGDAGNLASLKARLYVKNLGPSVYPANDIPGPMPYTGPTGGTSTTPTFPAPTTTGAACQFSSRGAASITDFIAPNGRVLLASHSISGAGTLVLPSTCDGYTVLLTTIPPGASHDAGDPPQFYQVGWTVPSRDGVEFDGAVRHITAAAQQFWGLNTLDGFLIYDLYPGYVATVDFYSAGVPI